MTNVSSRDPQYWEEKRRQKLYKQQKKNRQKEQDRANQRLIQNSSPYINPDPLDDRVCKNRSSLSDPYEKKSKRVADVTAGGIGDNNVDSLTYEDIIKMQTILGSDPGVIEQDYHSAVHNWLQREHNDIYSFIQEEARSDEGSVAKTIIRILRSYMVNKDLTGNKIVDDINKELKRLKE